MRISRFIILFGIAWTMQAGVCLAVDDWLDKLSGPGPFKNGLYVGYRFMCATNSQDEDNFGRLLPNETSKPYVTWLAPWDRTATVVPRSAPTLLAPPVSPDAAALQRYRENSAHIDCKRDQRVRGYLILTLRRWTTDRNELVIGDPDTRRVTIKAVDLGYVNRLNGALDVNVAVGLNHFSGPAFGSFDRVSGNYSLEFAPLAVTSDGPRAHAFKIIVGGRMFYGEFTAADFCTAGKASCANTTWRSNGHYELVPTVGLILDTSVWGK